jgi:hypothetical protein
MRRIFKTIVDNAFSFILSCFFAKSLWGGCQKFKKKIPLLRGKLFSSKYIINIGLKNQEFYATLKRF